MKGPLALVALQLGGAVSLLPYPLVLMASVMSLAAPGSSETLAGLAWMAFLSFSLVYPVIWAALWIASWVARRYDRPLLAIFISTPPALVSVAAIVFFALSAL